MDVAVKYPHHGDKNTSLLYLPLLLPSAMSSVSPYYFEKPQVILRAESNPSWRLIKATAPRLFPGGAEKKNALYMGVYMLHWMSCLFCLV